MKAQPHSICLRAFALMVVYLFCVSISEADPIFLVGPRNAPADEVGTANSSADDSLENAAIARERRRKLTEVKGDLADSITLGLNTVLALRATLGEQLIRWEPNLLAAFGFNGTDLDFASLMDRRIYGENESISLGKYLNDPEVGLRLTGRLGTGLDKSGDITNGLKVAAVAAVQTVSFKNSAQTQAFTGSAYDVQGTVNMWQFMVKRPALSIGILVVILFALAVCLSR